MSLEQEIVELKSKIERLEQRMELFITLKAKATSIELFTKRSKEIPSSLRVVKKQESE